MSIYYKKCKLHDHTTMDEHRYLMEQHIGHKLNKNQIVHHINGDMRDNRIENLEVMTRREHAQHHLTGREMPKEQREHLSKLRTGAPRRELRTVSDEQIKTALKLHGDGWKKRDIEDKCGFSMGTIYKMFEGKYARCKEFKHEIESSLSQRRSK